MYFLNDQMYIKIEQFTAKIHIDGHFIYLLAILGLEVRTSGFQGRLATT
jgi:hypothetical protein